MALVWSREIFTVLFLMAELCRRPLPRLGGLIIFYAHVFKRLSLGFSVFFVFFVDVGNRTNAFFVQEHILAKLARFARGVLIHATGLSRESIL